MGRDGAGGRGESVREGPGRHGSRKWAVLVWTDETWVVGTERGRIGSGGRGGSERGGLTGEVGLGWFGAGMALGPGSQERLGEGGTG